jgi:hypothetical protein
MTQQDIDFINSDDRNAGITDDFKLKCAVFCLLLVIGLMQIRKLSQSAFGKISIL